jgi:hypothetical protein
MSRNRVAGANGQPPELADAERVADADAAVVEMNKRHALVMVGDAPAVLQEYTDADGRPAFRLLSTRGFREWFRPLWAWKNEKRVAVADYWLSHPSRRRAEGIVFAPGQETPGWYNLWRGFAVRPDAAPDPAARCGRFLDHVAENVCEDDPDLFAWVMGWFAQMVQRPTEKLGTALVLRGPQGAGKTVVAEAVGSLLGPHYRAVSDAQRVTGRFNAHLASCLLLYLDEATWGGDHTAAGVLKDLVTGHELLIEYKGKEPVRVRNHLRLLFSSNNDWVIPAGLEERRFAVLDVGTKHQQDGPYFAALAHEMAHGGRAALLAYLLAYDVDAVPLRQVPSTAALHEQQVASLQSPAKWWLDVLHRGVLPGDTQGQGVATADGLYADYIAHAQRVGVARRAIETELGTFLARVVPGLVRERRMDASGARRRLIAFPALAVCRAAFAESLGRHRSVVTWPDAQHAWNSWLTSPTDRPSSGGS